MSVCFCSCMRGFCSCLWAENTQTRLFISSSEPLLVTICTKIYNVQAEIITSHQKVNQNHSPVQYVFNRKMNVFMVLKNILGFCQNMFYEWEGFFLTLNKEILTNSIIVLFITFTPHMAYIYNHGKFLSFSSLSFYIV